MERMWTDDGKLHVLRSQDPTPTLSAAAQLRSSGRVGDREKKLAALVPMALWEKWARDAGLKMHDPAMKDVIARKLNDPDYAHLRVWGGKV